jgi:hypothetical protein
MMTKTNRSMQDADDTDDESLTPDEHLEALLFQFLNLYERWSEDRQVTAKQSADLAKFVKEFAHQVGQFATLEGKVREDIQSSIRTEAENTAVYFSKTIGEEVRKEVAPTVDKIRAASDDAGRVLSGYQSAIRFANWEMVGVSVFSSILISILIVWFFMPKPTLPLTSQQARYLVTGESFNEIWPKLTKAEKERFKKLAEENWMVVHN